MSNGGYKGSTPARETSPEQYPGVWELTEQFQAQADGNWPFQETDCAPKSLRFDGSSAYLSRTLTASSNRRTWTMSMWVKRAKLGALQDLFSAGQEATNDGKYARFQFMADDTFRLRFWTEAGGLDANLQTTRVFRDCSAFYHFTIRHDSTETNQEDRLRIYVNGELITSYSSPDYLSSSVEGHWNYSAKTQMIGAHYDGGGSNTDSYFDGVIAEVHHIDGQSLPPEEFAFEDGQGIWQPKRFTGDYSSGPVYSNFITASNGGFHAAPYHQPAGFNGIVGTGSAGYVQAASGSNPNNLTFTPPSPIPYSNSVEVYIINAANTVSVNGGTAQNISANQWVTVASGTGVLTSLKFERPSTSGASFSGIKIDNQILLDPSVGRNSFHLDFSDGVKDQSGLGNNWTANSITLSSSIGVTKTVPQDVTGDWPGILGVTATNTSGTSAAIPDGGGSTQPNKGKFYWSGLTIGDTITFYGTGNHSSADNRNVTGAVSETTVSVPGSSSLGSFTLTVTAASGSAKVDHNGSFTCYGITPGITSGEFFVDSPVNGNEASTGAGGERRGNYCIWNPLDNAGTLTNGNLDFSHASAAYGNVRSTFAVSSGKWYWEGTVGALGGAAYIGIGKATASLTVNIGGADTWGYTSAGTKGAVNTPAVGYGASYTTGDIIGVAFDADNGTLTFYKNGVSQGSAYSNLISTYGSGPYFFMVTGYNGTTWSANFGQKAFSQTPPAGFSPLATSFLPEPSIPIPSQYFDTKAYSGTGSALTFTGMNLSPDLIWIKDRGPTPVSGHKLEDAVRGAGKYLSSNSTGAEVSPSNGVTSFNSDGFTLGTDNAYNDSGHEFIAWAWDAGTSTVTNNDGSIVSQVRANPSAGFSVISFTASGTAGSDSCGHGLNAVPGMVIIKRRDGADDWYTWHSSFSNAQRNYILLNQTEGVVLSGNDSWGAGMTSSVIGFRSQGTAAGNMIAYCFSPVSQYSAMGSYIGNGSANGPFVHTGFKPRYLLVKCSSAIGRWIIRDTARDTYNSGTSAKLAAEMPQEENNSSLIGLPTQTLVDFLSNGFKVRSDGGNSNDNGETYIYIAFAENPFKTSRAH